MESHLNLDQILRIIEELHFDFSCIVLRSINTDNWKMLKFERSSKNWSTIIIISFALGMQQFSIRGKNYLDFKINDGARHLHKLFGSLHSLTVRMFLRFETWNWFHSIENAFFGTWNGRVIWQMNTTFIQNEWVLVMIFGGFYFKIKCQ